MFDYRIRIFWRTQMSSYFVIIEAYCPLSSSFHMVTLLAASFSSRCGRGVKKGTTGNSGPFGDRFCAVLSPIPSGLSRWLRQPATCLPGATGPNRPQCYVNWFSTPRQSTDWVSRVKMMALASEIRICRIARKAIDILLVCESRLAGEDYANLKTTLQTFTPRALPNYLWK